MKMTLMCLKPNAPKCLKQEKSEKIPPTLRSYVKYGGRSPKYIWAPCLVMCTLTAALTG